MAWSRVIMVVVTASILMMMNGFSAMIVTIGIPVIVIRAPIASFSLRHAERPPLLAEPRPLPGS